MVKELSNWIENRLGKGIVYANDTINFIANRIGVFNLQSLLKHMEEAKLNVETVDALTGGFRQTALGYSAYDGCRGYRYLCSCSKKRL